MATTSWSGERLETFIHNAISIEHLHRYSLALPLAKQLRVLDIACGEGYGSNLLSANAAHVYGVDIDAETIARAKMKYTAANLEFIAGSADRIPLPDAAVDLVISFETIEHHDRHREMFAEIKRVLRPGGVLVMSSPEAGVSGFNPHHVKELHREEFTALVNGYFENTAFYFQKIVMGSLIVPQQPGRSSLSFHEGDYGGLSSSPQLNQPVYNLCLASDGVLPDPGSSFFEGRDVIVNDLLFPYLNSRLRKTIERIKTLFSIRSAHT